MYIYGINIFNVKSIITRKLTKSGRALSRSRSHDRKLLYQQKGLVTRSTHAKYESSTSYGAKVMANVKVFADGQTDRQSDYYRAPAYAGP